MDIRYQDAKAKAVIAGTERILADFESAITNSKAVIARSLLQTHTLVNSDNELYASFYQLIEGHLRLPSGGPWDQLRTQADSALFPNFKEHIKFAALSLDNEGLSSYGDCSLVLKESMIAHRASVFEENSVIWMQKKA